MYRIEFDIFRNNLRTLRIANGMTAKELSEKAGLKQLKRVADIEEGRGLPSLDEIYTFSKLFAVSLDQILFQELKITVQ